MQVRFAIADDLGGVAPMNAAQAMTPRAASAR